MQFKSLFALALAAVSVAAVPTGVNEARQLIPGLPLPLPELPILPGRPELPIPALPVPSLPALPLPSLPALPLPSLPALPLPELPGIGAGECNTGPIQCCTSLQNKDAPLVGTLLELLGIELGDITAMVGVTCSPISVIGVPGNSW